MNSVEIYLRSCLPLEKVQEALPPLKSLITASFPCIRFSKSNGWKVPHISGWIRNDDSYTYVTIIEPHKSKSPIYFNKDTHKKIKEAIHFVFKSSGQEPQELYECYPTLIKRIRDPWELNEFKSSIPTHQELWLYDRKYIAECPYIFPLLKISKTERSKLESEQVRYLSCAHGILTENSIMSFERVEHTYCLKEKMEVMRDAALGLKYLHGNNFIHRDVKLMNIFVTVEEGKVRGVLGDLEMIKRNPYQSHELKDYYAWDSLQCRFALSTFFTDIYPFGIALASVMWPLFMQQSYKYREHTLLNMLEMAYEGNPKRDCNGPKICQFVKSLMQEDIRLHETGKAHVLAHKKLTYSPEFCSKFTCLDIVKFMDEITHPSG